MVVEVFAPNWSALMFRGVVALLFGLLTFLMPAITLTALIFLFGAYALLDGGFTIIAAIRRRGRRGSHWVALLLGGIASVAIGILTFLYPGVTAIVLLYFIAAWAIITGIAEIAAGIRLRRMITGEWLLILAGLLSVAFGVLLVAAPGAGALAVTLWIGAYAFVLGIILIALGFRVRRWSRSHGEPAARPA